jgi:hypothetical protein
MKKIFTLLLIASMLFSITACGNSNKKAIDMEPKVSQMKAICELAVMDCYYHNVAKYFEKDANPGFLGIGKKDKHFWIEYSGVVKLGVDVSLVKIEVTGEVINITIPEAKVLGCKVDSATLTKDSFIVDSKSEAVTAEDEVQAFANAQKQLEETAANDTTLLANAQQQAMDLLEDYVSNIGNAMGKEYTINWIYLENQAQDVGSSAQTT